MITNQDWVLGTMIFLIPMTIIYVFQKTRWGIRIMSRESMRDQMAKEIGDRLWDRIYAGKIPLKEATRLSEILGELLELPDLMSRKRNTFKLKCAIQRRLKELRKNRKPYIPGEKPLQTVIRNIWTPAKKKLSSVSFKFNGK